MSAPRLSRHTDRLAELLCDERGALAFAEMQKLLRSARPQPLAQARAGQHDAPRSVDSGLVGVWRVAPGANRVRLVREASPELEHRRWADIDEVPDPGARTHRTVLIGESAARGFLHDPLRTVAGTVEAAVGDGASGGSTLQVVDLAIVGAEAAELSRLVDALPRLDADSVVLYAGSNWSIPRYTVGHRDELAHALRTGGPQRMREVFAHREYRSARTLVERLGRITDNLGITAIVIIPEFNLLGCTP